MNVAKFWISFDQSLILLKDLGMLREANSHKCFPYTSNCYDYSRSSDYKTIYQSLVDFRDYDIQLFDESLFQISFTNGDCRMLFIQNPNDYLSFSEFLSNIFDISEIDESELESLQYQFEHEYEQCKDEMALNKSAVYIRYDVDSNGRINNENIHAYTHLHIDINNKIRIPVSIYLTPLAFVLFIIRHVYYDKWVDFVRNTVAFNKYIDFKQDCEPLPIGLWTLDEQKSLFIS